MNSLPIQAAVVDSSQGSLFVRSLGRRMSSGPLSKSARERLERQRIDQRYTTTRTLIRAGALVICIWLFGKGLGALAGQETNIAVNAALSLIGDFKFALSLTLAGSAAAWGALERALRHRKVEYLQGRITELEKSIDPKRSTSSLTPEGKTNPYDRD